MHFQCRPTRRIFHAFDSVLAEFAKTMLNYVLLSAKAWQQTRCKYISLTHGTVKLFVGGGCVR